MRFAYIPLHTAGTQHGPRDSQRYAILCRDRTYTFGSFHPDAISGEQFFVLANFRSDEVEELLYFAFESFIGFVETAADAECVRGKARSAIFLEDLEDLFPVAEGVKKRSDGANIECMCPQPEHVTRQPVQFGQDDAYVFRARRSLNVQQLLD